MSDVIKIDVESVEFKKELEKTKKFTQKVVEQFGLSYNPDSEINQSVEFGLTRNKLIYGKRYCPCFFVTKSDDDRVCPCKPALEDEIPNEGKCHCGIFCTKEYYNMHKKEEFIEELAHTHSRVLSKDECELLLSKRAIDADELVSLIEAREHKVVEFLIVDTREWMENKMGKIKGTDYLIPTTSFYDSISQIMDKKDTPIVVYCHVGSRSAYCQQIMKSMGFKNVINLNYGIVGFNGEIIK